MGFWGPAAQILSHLLNIHAFFACFRLPFLTLYILLEALWGAVIGMIYNPALMITKARPDEEEDEDDEEDDEDDDFDDDFEDDEEE